MIAPFTLRLTLDHALSDWPPTRRVCSSSGTETLIMPNKRMRDNRMPRTL